MALTDQDLEAMRILMREETDSAFEARLNPFKQEVGERFEGLYAANEKRELVPLNGATGEVMLARCSTEGHQPGLLAGP